MRLLATAVFMLAMALIGAVLPAPGALGRPVAADRSGRHSAVSCLFFGRRGLLQACPPRGATPPEAAAWCPPLFALFAVLTLLAHAEDG